MGWRLYCLFAWWQWSHFRRLHIYCQGHAHDCISFQWLAWIQTAPDDYISLDEARSARFLSVCLDYFGQSTLPIWSGHSRLVSCRGLRMCFGLKEATAGLVRSLLLNANVASWYKGNTEVGYKTEFFESNRWISWLSSAVGFFLGLCTIGRTSLSAPPMHSGDGAKVAVLPLVISDIFISGKCH